MNVPLSSDPGSASTSRPALSLRIVTFSFTILFVAVLDIQAQTFTRLFVDNTTTWVSGASWVDFDYDGDLDLFTSHSDFGGVATFNPDRNRNKLFRNDGNDVFVEVTPAAIASAVGFSGGQTWADFDNDRDVDLYSVNKNYIYEAFLSTTVDEGSALYRNDDLSSGLFSRIESGDINGNNRISAFAGAWADYNNDGFVDLVLTTPRTNAFPTGDTLTNVLFDNNGDGTFSRNLSSPIVNVPIDFYTIPTWSDFDQDGDMDLFITNGPIQNGVTQPDLFFTNMLTETGTATFIRDETSSFATQSRDGQQANFVDYDNDRDLDLYVTNFGGTPGGTPAATAGTANHFYRNNGDGTYDQITSGPQSTDAQISFGQTWGDFDNDGDLDLYVTNFTSANSTGGNNYYQNQGFPDYTFERLSLGTLTTTGRAGWGATSGDYDNDGDLDLFITVTTLTGRDARDELYRNDLGTGAAWINITCEGVVSNYSAIGARVFAKATVFGNSYWQMREISAQNAGTGQNSLRVHFGFGDATVIDSLRIVWPSGMIDMYEDVETNQFLTATEGQDLGPVKVSTDPVPVRTGDSSIRSTYPNPANANTRIGLELGSSSFAEVDVINLLGQRVGMVSSNSWMSAGAHDLTFDVSFLRSGIYFVRLKTPTVSDTARIIVAH